MTPTPGEQVTVFPTLEQILADRKAKAEANAVFDTKRGVVAYLLACSNIDISVKAGRLTPDDAAKMAPPIPKKYAAQDLNKTGWFDSEPTDEPACAPFVFSPDMTSQPPKTQNHQHIGRRNFGDWFACGSDDTIASGTTMPGTSDDGVTGLFQKFGAAVGPGWYLKVG